MNHYKVTGKVKVVSPPALGQMSYWVLDVNAIVYAPDEETACRVAKELERAKAGGKWSDWINGPEVREASESEMVAALGSAVAPRLPGF